MSIHDFPGNKSFMDDADDEAPTYDYEIHLKSGATFKKHGWLVVTPSLAAIGIGSSGVLIFCTQMDSVDYIERVESHKSLDA